MCIRDRAKAALEATTNALKEALIAGDKIQLVGFGTFSINERPAREGINPDVYKRQGCIFRIDLG